MGLVKHGRSGRGLLRKSPQLVLHPDERLNGSGDCNVFCSNHMLQNDEIKVGPPSFTKCNYGEPIDQVEARYFSISVTS